MSELEMKLPDSFARLPYTSNHIRQHSENWMKTVVDETRQSGAVTG